MDSRECEYFDPPGNLLSSRWRVVGVCSPSLPVQQLCDNVDRVGSREGSLGRHRLCETVCGPTSARNAASTPSGHRRYRGIGGAVAPRRPFVSGSANSPARKPKRSRADSDTDQGGREPARVTGCNFDLDKRDEVPYESRHVVHVPSGLGACRSPLREGNRPSIGYRPTVSAQPCFLTKLTFRL